MPDSGSEVELWVVLTAAFGSALLGAAVGGALTYWGQRNLAEHDLTRRRTGIIKAVIGELRTNVTLVSAVIAGWTGPVPFSRAVWAQANFDMAQFIAEDAYRKLMVVYGGLPSMQHHCDAIQTNRPDDDASR